MTVDEEEEYFFPVKIIADGDMVSSTIPSSPSYSKEKSRQSIVMGY
jgi:hypothetical protein